MDLRTIIATVKQLIGAGNLEQALDQLVAFLDADPRYADLAQTIRINQADLYQNKSQVLKGTIAPDDARLAVNKITDNTLQVLRILESGPNAIPQPGAPTRSQAWRYYTAGGVVALAGALLVWQLFFKKKEDCPNNWGDATHKVMILPFSETGEKKNQDVEVELAGELNNLITNTNKLSASADIKKTIQNDDGYINPEEATQLARECGVQMVIWGKINYETDGYKLDVYYRLLNEGGVFGRGDTTVSNLLKVHPDGRRLANDVTAMAQYLYIVLANEARVPIASNLIASTQTNTTMKTGAEVTMITDTSLEVQKAINLQIQGKTKEAVIVYNKLLDQYPFYSAALEKRGALLYQMGDYGGAARDLTLAAPNPVKADTQLWKVRIDASIKASQPSRAQSDLKALEKIGGIDKTWLKAKTKEALDTMSAIDIRVKSMEQSFKTKPRDTQNQLNLSKANIQTGHPDKALNHANQILTRDKKNVAAYELAIEAQLQKGDTTSAVKVLRQAERNGVNVKGIITNIPVVKPLRTTEQEQQKDRKKQ